VAIDFSNPGLRILPADIPTGSTPAGLGTSSISGADFGSGEGSFGATLKEAVGDVDTLALDARYKVSNMIESNGADVHDAMIAVEKADLSFQLMLQVRNKVVQAYQQVAGMQF